MPAPPSQPLTLSRARWYVIQSGLITTGLALFGVYVLSSRTNDLRVMLFYVLTFLPAGPMAIGFIAGAGYALGAWWAGVRVRGGLLAAILLLQLSAYTAAQYAEFASIPTMTRRDTGEPVGFFEYFRYTTLTLLSNLRDPSRPARFSNAGYTLRAVEASMFLLGGLGSALVLVGQPQCALCRGRMLRRRLATVSASVSAQALSRLQKLAVAGDPIAFRKAVELYDEGAAQREASDAVGEDQPVALCIVRCLACGNGFLEVEPSAFAPDISQPTTPVTGEFAAALFAAAAAPTG
jgi:hypothetical protein